MTDWIGKTLARNKPHNFFKTNGKYKPVNLFGDSDRDGVMNVFDCKPYNPRKQGLIDAIVGAVKGIGKGGVKAGWKEGMARQGNPVSRRYEAYRERKYPVQSVPVRTKATSGMNEGVYPTRYRRYLERATPLVQGPLQEGVSPEYERRFRGRKIKQYKQELSGYKKELGNPDLSAKQKMKLRNKIKSSEGRLENARRVQEKATIEGKALARRQLGKSFVKGLASAFPMVTPMSGKHVMGAPGQKGRPRGSLDPRYAKYGGVYGWRKYMSQQRKLQKEQLKQQLILMKQQAVPQYERQQYQSQPASQPTPEEQMVAQMEAVQQPNTVQAVGTIPQYPQQQYPQQYPQESQKRPIATVFKGSGGKPYPAVESQPLAPSRQTVPYGYVETVDAFTGRRFLKPLPRSERWTG